MFLDTTKYVSMALWAISKVGLYAAMIYGIKIKWEMLFWGSWAVQAFLLVKLIKK